MNTIVFNDVYYFIRYLMVCGFLVEGCFGCLVVQIIRPWILYKAFLSISGTFLRISGHMPMKGIIAGESLFNSIGSLPINSCPKTVVSIYISAISM